MVISRHVIYIADQSNARQAGDSRASRSQRENNKHVQGKQAGRVSPGVRWERGRKGEGSARSGGEVGWRDASTERVRRGAQYLTPASTLLLLGQTPLQALDLRVQLSLKSTQLRNQTGLSPAVMQLEGQN